MPEFDATTEYRDVEGFPGYKVGSDGSVWSCRPINGRGPLKATHHELAPAPDPRGRFFVNLRAGDRRRLCYVHHLILEAFVGPRPEGLWGLHADDNPSNNRVGNLRWGTRADNAKDAIRNNKQVQGERCHKAKFTTDEILAMRSEFAAGKSTLSQLAHRRNVTRTTISRIIHRETWKHV